MSVMVNGRFLKREITGVERYGTEILRCLQDRLQVMPPGRWWRGIGGHLWEQLVLPRQLQSTDLLWSPANTGPLIVHRQVLTLHDISPLEHPSWFTPAFASWYRLFLPVLLRTVRRVVVSSNYMRQKLLSRFALSDERVSVAPGGVDCSIFHPSAVQNLDLPARYVLFVGSLQPRKNLVGLLEAWSLIEAEVADVWLVIAGTDGRQFRTVQLPVSQRVLFLGYVPDASLPGLYAHADLFILPSFEEGFGLPILEAMASGTPVLAAEAGALPEVVSEAGLSFDLHESRTMADSLQLILKDEGLRATLRLRGLARAAEFPWQNSAEKIWSVLEACR